MDTKEGEKNVPNGTATATSAAPATAAASPSQSKRGRKLTDEQLAAHREEQGWCADVLAELCRRLDLKQLLRAGQQKSAAKWFYGELHAVEDGQKRLWQCYDLTKRDPFWHHKTLLLSDLVRPFPEYRRDPKGYREDIERANKPRAASSRPQRVEPSILPAARPSDPFAKPAPVVARPL